MPRVHHGYRGDIDGLRAIAVVPVVLFHAGVGCPGGFTGVDVFFVISGFLITSLIAAEIDAGKFSIAGFYERRIRRIFPALFVVLAASAVAAWCLFLPPEFMLFGKSLALTAVFTSNIGFWSEAGYFDTIAQFKPLLHTWSLGVEEQFYIVFPLLLASLSKRMPGRRVAVVAGLTAVSFAASLWWVAKAPAGAFYLLPPRFWELGIGSLLALVPGLSARTPAQGLLMTAAGIALMAAAVFGLSESMAFPGAAALLPCVGAGLAIAGGAQANLLSKLLAMRPFTFIGLLSYSLYLWHWPVIVFTQYRLGHLLTGVEASGVITLSLLAAYLSWRFVEQPVRRRLVMATRPALFRAGAVAMGVAVAAGFAIPAADGVPSRLPAEVLAFYQAKADVNEYGDAKCFEDHAAAIGSATAMHSTSLCSMGAPRAGAAAFLVWGDSHAAAMAPAIATAAQGPGKHGVFVGRGGCLPLIGYDANNSNTARRAACRARNNAVVDMVARERIPLVFLVGRWPREVLGAENGKEGPFYDPAAPYETHDRSRAVAAGLNATLASLGARGARVVLVMDVPEPGYDVPVALARAALRKTPVNVNPSRAAVELRQKLARNVLTGAAKKWHVQFVDPTSAFCDASSCAVEVHGVPRYVDADHITRTMSVSLARLFEACFGATSARTLVQPSARRDGASRAEHRRI